MERNYNVTHPELSEGEMFLTNVLSGDYRLIGWKTKRTGVHAYTINGEDATGYTPVFDQKEEYEEGMKKHDRHEQRRKRYE